MEQQNIQQQNIQQQNIQQQYIQQYIQQQTAEWRRIIETELPEIRRITPQELPQALQLAALNYHVCLEPTVSDPQMNRFFYQSLNPEELRKQQKNGDLIVWGVCIRNILLGVSAMTKTGQITMLYVHPDYQKQGIGEKLLQAMKDEASILGLKVLFVNAAPGWTGRWFYHEGFKAPGGSLNPRAAFCPMILQLSGIRSYRRTPFPDKKIQLAVLASLLTSLFLVAGYTLFFIFH